jgi:hypothetical protein
LQAHDLIGLDFHKMPITDKGLANIEHLRGLETLVLNDTDFCDAGFASVVKLTGLHRLAMYSTNVTGAGLRKLRIMRNLRELDISRVPLNDDPLDFITDLGRLIVLDCGRSELGDRAAANIASVKGLMQLGINGNTRLTRAGVVKLAKLSRLEGLHIDFTGVRTEDARTFENFRALKDLYIGGDGFTPDTVAQWQRRLPRVKIHLQLRNQKLPVELFNPRGGNYALPKSWHDR